MKTTVKSGKRPQVGYALIIVLTTCAIAGMMLASTMNRTSSVQRMNDRNNQYNVGLNAAEAACEKAFCRMSFDFATYGAGTFAANLSTYQGLIPNENTYWTNFDFFDATGVSNKTSVFYLTNYTGDLPSQYPGLFTSDSDVYRVISNVRVRNSRYPITNAVQVDVLLARVPITTYAIFYNGLLEFSTAATMTVNGRVHSNNKIYTGSSSTLTFNSTVTSVGSLSSPYNNGSGPWTFPGGTFNGSPQFSTNVASVTLSINMTNTHQFIEMPVTNDAATTLGSQRLYNQAAVLLLISNNTLTTVVQTSPGLGQVAGEDPTPLINTFSNTPVLLSSNLPFLSITNTFLDQREDKTNLVAQIDIAKYTAWMATNADVIAKYPSSGSAAPTILYVANNRTNQPGQLPSVRLVNGTTPPYNKGIGFTVATPNPLYVLGNYNQTNSSLLYSTNTSSGTIPCALISDAFTILSSSWSDATSFTLSQSGPNAASAIQVNAAIITGVVPSTGTNSGQFSGGVHNLPRLLENWGSSTVWLNTSIVNLYSSTIATNKFVTPGTGSYYSAPTRKFSFDVNFNDPDKQPPGVPTAMVPIRFNWAVPPPKTTNYYVTP